VNPMNSVKGIETKRFNLRPLKQSDKGLFYHLYQDPFLCINLGGALSDEQAEIAFNVSLKKNHQIFERFTWTIWDGEQSIGICSLVKSKVVANASDLGTVIIEEYHAKGVAKEVLARITDYGFEELGLDSLVGWSYFKNKISEKLMHSLSYDCRQVFDTDKPGNYWSLTHSQWAKIKSEESKI